MIISVEVRGIYTCPIMNTLSGQDWNTVTFRGKNATQPRQIGNQGTHTAKKQLTNTAHRLHQVDKNEIGTLDKVGSQLASQLVKCRTQAKLNQDTLAKNLGVAKSEIQKLEKSQTVLNASMKSLLHRVLSKQGLNQPSLLKELRSAQKSSSATPKKPVQRAGYSRKL